MVELKTLSGFTPRQEPNNNCPDYKCPFISLLEHSDLDKKDELRRSMCEPCKARAKTDNELNRLKEAFLRI
ncbi:MAG TPA: hypothetical protein VF185_04130 [Patescibacteria group bacterium]